MLERFKRTYAQAAANQSAAFTFDGNEFDPGYAKYLIEYLEGLLHA